ncbi:hypothetical protein SEMRO_16_G011550.1 [Seminavis robusta]|uniref:Uncharacterized protein n=1 Tax=Seminavis robusta TaxID=568900 RepID=A0A9N8H2B1_9STRA|nr:hypothetical protein SEMRO_16_G011550.1 [Seminavis robusta]|eukprot:Sro16_g011550.1 n/a (251) ;mRNA; r:28343-29095
MDSVLNPNLTNDTVFANGVLYADGDIHAEEFKVPGVNNGDLFQMQECIEQGFDFVADGSNYTALCHSPKMLDAYNIAEMKAFFECFNLCKVDYFENCVTMTRRGLWKGVLKVYILAGGSLVSWKPKPKPIVEAEEEASVATDCSAEFDDDFVDITGQGMSQQTHIIYEKIVTPKKIVKPVKVTSQGKPAVKVKAEKTVKFEKAISVEKVRSIEKENNAAKATASKKKTKATGKPLVKPTRATRRSNRNKD